jgi:hypothetical protein
MRSISFFLAHFFSAILSKEIFYLLEILDWKKKIQKNRKHQKLLKSTF